jgi:hypothetical protein
MIPSTGIPRCIHPPLSDSSTLRCAIDTPSGPLHHHVFHVRNKPKPFLRSIWIASGSRSAYWLTLCHHYFILLPTLLVAAFQGSNFTACQPPDVIPEPMFLARISASAPHTSINHLSINKASFHANLSSSFLASWRSCRFQHHDAPDSRRTFSADAISAHWLHVQACFVRHLHFLRQMAVPRTCYHQHVFPSVNKCRRVGLGAGGTSRQKPSA